MNIDTNKLRKRLALFGAPITNSGIDSILETCEIKPVDCDECSNMGEVCNKCIHNKFADDYFKQKEKQWYEKPESFPCLCHVWCSCSLVRAVSIIASYDINRSEYINVNGVEWQYATPLTKTELLSYCLEEK